MRKQLWSNVYLMNFWKVGSHSLGMLLTYPSVHNVFLLLMLFLICLSNNCNNQCTLLLSIDFAFCFCSLFFKQEMELSLVGLQNAGKTSLVNSIAVS